MGLYSYSFQPSRGACGRANRHAGWRLESGAFALAARLNRRPKPRSPGAPAARHGVRALFRRTRPKARRKKPNSRAVGVCPPGKRGASRNAPSARDAGSPAMLAVTTISVCFPLSHTEPGARLALRHPAPPSQRERQPNAEKISLRHRSATTIPPAQNLFGRKAVRICKPPWRRNTPVMLPQSAIPNLGDWPV